MAPHLFYFHFPLQITKIVLLFFFSWNIRRFEIFKREFEWSMMTSKQAQSFSTLSYHRALHCIGHWTPLIHWQGIVKILGTLVTYGLKKEFGISILIKLSYILRSPQIFDETFKPFFLMLLKYGISANSFLLTVTEH